MISTGMYGIDDMLGGGIPEGARVLYSLEPGVDGQLFMVSTLYEALEKGHSCLVILPHMTSEEFLCDTAKLRGRPLMTKTRKLVFVDSADREEIRQNAPKGSAAAGAWQVKIKQVCTDNKVDTIFGYFDLLYEDFGLDTGLSLLPPEDCAQKFTIIIEHLNFEGDAFLEAFAVRKSFDLILAIKSSNQPLPHFHYFTILYSSWASQVRRSVPFLVRDGHIVPYIPKIVVTGAPGSGKSLFVEQATELRIAAGRPMPEGNRPTGSMDFGWLRWKDFDITLYGTPGQERFDLMLPTILHSAMGVVLLVDATTPASFARAHDILKTISATHMPVVIAATKTDLPGCMNGDEIRKGIGAGPALPVFLISAQHKDDVRRVLEALVESITRYIP